MKNETNLREELLALLEQTGEYVSYLRELGVERIEVSADSARPAFAPAVAKEQSVARPAASPRVAALHRSAEVTDAPHDAPDTTAPQLIKATIDMPKRTEKKYPDADPPLPQDTLFGEVTPQDEESLPRPGETLEDIRQDIGVCMRCPLRESRTQVVNSEGNEKARLMFVGEAPGADEDAQGHPFIGRAGQLLSKIIEAIGMKRQDVFIGNVNRCRPPQNRTPTPGEAATCKPFLLREIAIVRPEVIVVLGNTAMKNLLDTKEGITRLRGKFQDYRGIKVMPTFHPAYLLRDPSKKRETWEDMKLVRDYLDGKVKG